MHILAQGTPSSSGVADPTATSSLATTTPSTPSTGVGTSSLGTSPAPKAAQATTSQATTTQPTTTPVVAPVVLQEIASKAPPSANNFPLILIGGGVVLIALAAIALVLRKNKPQAEEEEKNCDSLKSLLEQKKQELEEMVKGWPQDKLAEVVEGKLLSPEIRELKERYDKLKEAIDLLQKRFDLCMLSLPSVEGPSYSGTIVENILMDKKILDSVDILKTKKAGEWVLHNVSAKQKEVERLAGLMASGTWFMHFWQEDQDTGLVVFKDKVFPIKYKDKSTWREAVAYGKSIGIPAQELDFKVL